jgi:hypothetical protein
MQKTKTTDNITLILFVILFAIVIAAVTSTFSPGAFNAGFWAALKLSIPGGALMVLAWLRTGRGKLAAAMMLIAFVLRLAAGLATTELLPIYGYTDEPQQKQGYLFDDAYRRDDEAWRIANEEQPSFFEPLGRTYNNDQYGGMTVLGIWIYRYLSPDARRYQLLILLGAFVFAAGTAYLLRALRDWEYLQEPGFEKTAAIATWIYVLYPDSIVYSASPMREPFLMGLLAVAFWALTRLKHNTLRSGLTLVGIFLVILPFSYFIAGALVAVSMLWFWAEMLIPRSKNWLYGGIGLTAVVLILTFLLALPTIQDFVHYDIHTTEISSGWVEKVVGEIGGQFRSIFLAIYGITQPVLPAILFYQPTTPFWKVTGIFRALGWYLLVPFLFYALFVTLRVQQKPKRNVYIVNALFIAGWIFVSSLRAGGDQWDNPRYRVIFLPWLAFFSAWGICEAKRLKDWWLVRWIAIEVIFVIFFSQWYYSRYSGDAIRRFPFWRTVTYIVICSGAVFLTGLINPIRKRLKGKKE